MADIFVIIKSTGEYSDRMEEVIRYVLTEESAIAAVARADEEKQRDVRPKWPDMLRTYDWYRDGRQIDNYESGAKFQRTPDSEFNEAENNRRKAEYYAQCLALGHVDLNGGDIEAIYRYARVPPL